MAVSLPVLSFYYEPSLNEPTVGTTPPLTTAIDLAPPGVHVNEL